MKGLPLLPLVPYEVDIIRMYKKFNSGFGSAPNDRY